MNRTILKFNSGEDIYEVNDNTGKPVDPLDLADVFEELNSRTGLDLYKPDFKDCTVEGEDVNLVLLDENEDGVTTEIATDAANHLSVLMAEKDWYMEETEIELPEEEEDWEEDEDEEDDWSEDDDYQSSPDDF